MCYKTFKTKLGVKDKPKAAENSPKKKDDPTNQIIKDLLKSMNNAK